MSDLKNKPPRLVSIILAFTVGTGCTVMTVVVAPRDWITALFFGVIGAVNLGYGVYKVVKK